MHIQYLGFQTGKRGRDYSYRVTATKSENREFTLTIPTEAFSERHVCFQDGADICYRKLREALDVENDGQPLPHHFIISDQELEAYREKYRPVRRRSW
ncbi:MAG: hypothetical protein ACRD22_17505 [Terriglobia bacterium]